MLIGKSTIGKITGTIDDLLETYLKEMNVSLDENGGVDVALPVKVKQRTEKLEVQVGISFVKNRVKDSRAFIADDQQELFVGEVSA